MWLGVSGKSIMLDYVDNSGKEYGFDVSNGLSTYTHQAETNDNEAD